MGGAGRVALAAMLVVAACGGDGADGAAPDAAAARDTTDSAAAAPAAPAIAVEDTPSELYFDLTLFDWYRRGEPLVHQGRRYQAMGDPVVESAESMAELGRYQGVAYYRRQDAADPVYTVYVPVYYRYWQRFVAPPG